MNFISNGTLPFCLSFHRNTVMSLYSNNTIVVKRGALQNVKSAGLANFLHYISLPLLYSVLLFVGWALCVVPAGRNTPLLLSPSPSLPLLPVSLSSPCRGVLRNRAWALNNEHRGGPVIWASDHCAACQPTTSVDSEICSLSLAFKRSLDNEGGKGQSMASWNAT